MSRVDIDNLTDGMVFGQDVIGPDGEVLIPAGSVLSRKHRVVLDSAGVPFVEITDESAGLAELLFDADPGTRHLENSVAAQAREEQPMRKRPTGVVTPIVDVDPALVQRRLVMLAHLFGEFRDDPIMRKLCRLAIKCAKEGLIGA